MVYNYPRCRQIVVDDASKAYRNEVVRYLDLIATTDVGRTLYEFMGRATKTVRITWHMGDDWLQETGAAAFSDEDVRRIGALADNIARERHIGLDAAIEAAWNEDPVATAKRRGQYAKGHPVMQQVTIRILRMLGLPTSFMFPTAEAGTGAGADVELDYHPAAFEQLIKKTGRIPLGFGPGEVLYHELVHALRMMTGVMLDENVPERWNMDDFEEFCSILASNMYRSARGFTQLRFDHHLADWRAPWRGSTELPGELTNSRRYYEFFKPEIVKWFNSQRAFCIALAGSRARFNPMAVAAADLGFRVAR